jgi:hypothetical protein
MYQPALGALLLASLAPAAGAQGERRDAGAAYNSPQAVFEAAQAAQKKDDFKTFVACFTAEAQKDMAAGMAFQALQQQATARNDEKLRTAYKAILDVLNKYGLTDEVGKKMKLRPASPQEAEKLQKEIQGLIKDPANFAVDLLTAYSKTEPFNQKPPDEPTPQLTDVKVDGDKARGTVVVKAQGREFRQPVEFVKLGGNWKWAPQPQPAPPRPAGGPAR